MIVSGEPLLTGLILTDHLDAALTYWSFIPKLEMLGFHEILSVPAAARSLGIMGDLSLVGFVFERRWGRTDALPKFRDELAGLRSRFLRGLTVETADDQERDAALLFTVIKQFGGEAVGGLDRLPDGVFWR